MTSEDFPGALLDAETVYRLCISKRPADMESWPSILRRIVYARIGFDLADLSPARVADVCEAVEGWQFYSWPMSDWIPELLAAVRVVRNLEAVSLYEATYEPTKGERRARAKNAKRNGKPKGEPQ